MFDTKVVSRGKFTESERNNQGHHHHAEIGIVHEIIGFGMHVFAPHVLFETFLDTGRDTVHDETEEDK